MRLIKKPPVKKLNIPRIMPVHPLFAWLSLLQPRQHPRNSFRFAHLLNLPRVPPLRQPANPRQPFRGAHAPSRTRVQLICLDSSVIALCLNLFPRGYYARTRKAAVKWHLRLSLQGNLPAWAAITEADFPDMKMLDDIPVIPGAYDVMDRGYLDFVRLFQRHQAGGFFVVRSKCHVKFRVTASRPVDQSTGLRCDQTIQLTGKSSSRSYPQPLRRIRVCHAANKASLILLTNQFEVPALVITGLYRQRWQVELFFKWIKQHLRLRAFYGRSENAVRCQIWPAIRACLLVAIVKKKLQIQKTLNEMLQIVSVNIFEQTPLPELLATNPGVSDCEKGDGHSHKLLLLKD